MTSTISSDQHRVGAGLSVRFSGKHVGDMLELDVEWTPRMPTKREMRRVLDRYRGARDAFFTELASNAGISITLIEV